MVYFNTYKETPLLEMTNIPPAGVKKAAYQGTAIYDNYVVQCYHSGYVNLFDLSANREDGPVAVFKLGSFNDGAEAMRPEGERWDPKCYINHSNQAMFGTRRWDESDPFPLLYVTIGNKGWKMEDGSYIAKCAVERILCDKKTGRWSSQLVQIIEFNDIAFVDEGTGRQGTVALKDGRFVYSDTETWKNTQNYEVPCWGWPAYFVDSDPIALTEGKLYIHSARFRTAWSAVGDTATGNYRDAISGFDSEKHNAYIITQFTLPELPENEEKFGQTVTLTPAHIESQFTTEYDIWGTQGGTLYQGRIYYPFGFGAQPGAEHFVEKRNGLRVYDIAQRRITCKVELWEKSAMKTVEPEGCAIYDGKLALSYNTAGENLWLFDIIEQLNVDVTVGGGKTRG
ncbi:MAG: hypothetical protein IJZ85_10495 [Lachnospiraceae bacterium]|nr:hypothetical protein [Lachnospiraceae bacterium]